MNTLTFAIAALIVDLAVGDPRWLPHPVIGFGKAIAWFERRFRVSGMSPAQERGLGIALVFFLLAVTLIVSFVLLKAAAMLHPIVHVLLSIWLISTTIAVKGLKEAAMQVYDALAAGDLKEARIRVGYIVGRDTDTLPEGEVSRAAVETVAENIVDAFVSPLFYALLAGPYGALLYRATNTLDSMVGYKNDKYRYFGWASARLDDVLNYVPARITGCLLWFVALLSRKLNARESMQAMLRDAAKHPSPNSGIPESAVAGALGIQLGGENRYGGVVSVRARMGEAHRNIVSGDIPLTVGMMYKTAVLIMLLLLILAGWLWWRP
ncbi:adenosylcobinamide-phosphate synthase CbiB [Paenibacillus thalictri]|uniref:Cobalamin biosynthesis protein CobD n=1 Tax=Paenibacillus thalictri TaxID=2527873 RepID=A0A4Q9DPP3_9BACL|nr:adenosylcobinamide-phosphate synthase CbiB [Paenibacillus thalictri]TBL78285.1 cobalamin biosynthesis protein CobD [Paenibacillus thalictri]